MPTNTHPRFCALSLSLFLARSLAFSLSLARSLARVHVPWLRKFFRRISPITRYHRLSYFSLVFSPFSFTYTCVRAERNSNKGGSFDSRLSWLAVYKYAGIYIYIRYVTSRNRFLSLSFFKGFARGKKRN